MAVKKHTRASLERGVREYFGAICCPQPVCGPEGEALCGRDGSPLFKELWITPPTVAGLRHELGLSFEEFEEFCREEHEFSSVLAPARRRIEKYLEEQLCRERSVDGIKAALSRNFGWKSDPRGRREDIEIVIKDVLPSPAD